MQRSTTVRALLLAATAALAAAVPASAVTTVTTVNGAGWQIHDIAPPKLDTGSIRAISGNAFYGFGGIRVRVSGIPANDPSGRLNGELMRGFGLTFNGTDAFATTAPIVLGGVAISRAVKVGQAGNWTRWLDTFANTTNRPITVDVAFGGSAGQNSGTNQSRVMATSSGDALMGADDVWTMVANPSGTANASSRGPHAVVGSQQGMGNFQRDPFGNALPATGLEANFYAYKNTLTLAPGETRSLLRYVVAGTAETTATAGQQVAAVQSKAVELAATPDLTGIAPNLGCTVVNWPALFDAPTCAANPAPPVTPSPEPKLPVTTSGYDVFDKSITQLEADLKSGLTTSQAITRAYLDRIAAYDGGPFGFHSFVTVADDAMAQAAVADARRAAGESGELLGIPVAVKDLYDTKDMPTTDGTLALEHWRPKRDAGQVKRLRDAGAVIIGKTILSEFANSGSYSESGYGMTWGAFKPSKTPLGSSGGSAVATALSFAGFSLGSQTGVSLYAPATGASLVTMRGTDGIASGAGVMPLTWLQDFAGPIARTTSDIARILNTTTGTDPDDIYTVHADADGKRPADWKAALDPNALQGKRIGYVQNAFTGSLSYGQDDGTPQALLARFADIEAAGATMVPITAGTPATASPGTLSGNRSEEGWQRYWDLHEDPPFTTGYGILSSPLNLPYNRQNINPRNRLNQNDINAILASRDENKRRWTDYMNQLNVDAIVYPGFRSDVYDNDGAQTLSSDRGSNVPTSNIGLPTLILPVGANPHGDPMSLQFVGRAWDDAKMLGFGYALEQQLGGAGHLVPTTAPRLTVVTETTAPVGGTVPATLTLALGTPAQFGAFTPGVAQTYEAGTTANVISTAGDATLTVTDPSTNAPGRLVNGSFALPQPLLAGGSPLPATLKTWAGPTSNESVPIQFSQAIGATDPLRTGTYAKTLTFTLSTTSP